MKPPKSFNDHPASGFSGCQRVNISAKSKLDHVTFPTDHPREYSKTFQKMHVIIIESTLKYNLTPYTKHVCCMFVLKNSSLDIDFLNHPSRSCCHSIASSGILPHPQSTSQLQPPHLCAKWRTISPKASFCIASAHG